MSSENSANSDRHYPSVNNTPSQCGSIDAGTSPDAYAEYQAELDRLKAALQPAIEQHERGEGEELDLNSMVEQIPVSGRGS